MAAKDYSNTPDANTNIGDAIYIGPNMDRNNARPAFQQLAADLRGVYDEVVTRGTTPAAYVANGAGAVTREINARLRDTLSVFDFIPVAEQAGITNGTSTTDVTAYINAAITAARAIPFSEKRLVFPSGTYRFTQMALRDCSYFTLHADGTVQLIGIDGTQGFIFGDDRFDEFGHVEEFTSNFRMTGGPWLIAPADGQTYARGMLLQNFIDSVFENVSVSGTYANGSGTGHRIAVELELSFNNAFHNISVGYPGAPIGADSSYGLWLGGDNCNNNRFFNYRGVGGGHTVAKTYGARVDSVGNLFTGFDISAIHTAFELNAARGCHFIGGYHESVSGVCTVDFASRGCIFNPSYVNIKTGGTAYDFGGDSGTVQTIGMTIMGGEHVFDPTGTTSLKKGANCYGLTYRPGINLASLPAVAKTGTDRGSGGSALLDANELSTAKIAFPDTASISDNPTTLDDYREGSWFPTAGGGVTFVESGGTYTKVGNSVRCRFSAVWPAAGNGNNATIGNLPFAPTNTDEKVGAAIGYQVNPNGYVLALIDGELSVIDPATGANKTNTEAVDLVIHGSIEYATNE